MTFIWVVIGTLLSGGYLAVAVPGFAHRPEPGSLAFSTLTGLLAGLSLLVTGRQIGVVPVSLDPLTQLVLIAGYVFAALSWIGFVFEYTGRGPGITRQRATILAAFGSFVCLTTTVTWSIETGLLEGGGIGQGTYFLTFLAQIVVFSLGALGVILVLRSAMVDEDLGIDRGLLLGGSGLMITLLPVSIGFGRFLVGGSTWALTIGQFGVILVLFSLCQYRNGIFAASPVAGYLGRATALETMSDPVFVTDSSGRVLDVNRAARRTFDVPRDHRRAQTITDVVGIATDELPESPVAVNTRSGRQQYSITRSEVTGVDSGVIGYSYRFKNVTKRETRKQRLQVLNRVIRHNLRNDLDAIRGFAEAIQADDVDANEKQAYFDRIETLSGDVIDTASSVDSSSKLLTEERLEREEISLDAIAEEMAATVEIPVDLTGASEPVTIRSNREVVQAVIRELLDNTVKHADRDGPTVGVRTESTEFGARITVWDDGPGIPAQERAVLLDGEETPARHGSGVGLWLVSWGVDRIGGTLEFTEREPRGSEVTIRIPALQDRTASATDSEI